MQKSSKLLSFIQASKISLLNVGQNKIQTLRIVIGNETSDMDSTFGSILLAYLYNHLNKDPNVKIVPLMNKKYNSFQSAFELTYLLEKEFDIPLTTLVFLNDIDIHYINQQVNMELILFDHNVLTNFWQTFQSNVIEILDHHQDKSESSYPKLANKQIELLGSATTIVSEKYRQVGLSLIDGIITKMILSTVTLDTFNFDPKLQHTRWVQRDLDALNFYTAEFCPTFDRNEYYKSINLLKYSKEMNFSLEMDQLIYKDYKEFKYSKGNVGFAIIFLRLETLFEKYAQTDLIKLWNDHCSKNSLDIFVIMFVHHEQDKLEREVLIFSDNQQLRGQGNKNIILKIAISLLEIEIQKLKVERLPFQFISGVYYKDIDAIYSRKIIEPLIAKALSN